MRRVLVCLGLAAVVFGVSSPAVAQQQPNPSPSAVADIKDASGHLLANAELHEDRGKVQVALSLSTPSTLTGKHALHVMEVGRCDPPDFMSAGGIFNPFGKQHGLLASGGPMVGDLPNLNMPLQRYNAPALGATIGPGPGSLFGPRGTALVIYARPDDELTNPEGNAGARVACGVITPTAAQAQAAQPSSPGFTVGPALLLAALGALLIGAGLVLRRPQTGR
jgi:Cu-Zn family superoxide dismutase